MNKLNISDALSSGDFPSPLDFGLLPKSQEVTESHRLTRRFLRLSFLIFLCLFSFTTNSFAQNQHRHLKNADEAYLDEDFKAAEENYRKAVEKKPLARANYNMGNAIFRQERLEEAVEKFQSAAESASDPVLQSAAYHNLGNAHFGLKEYDKSVNAFKKALRLNSKDVDTKKNLARAQRQLRVQQQQQQQEQQQQNQEEQEKNENQEQQEQQQQQEQQEEEKEQEQEEQQQQDQDVENEEEQKGEAPQPEDLSKQEAEKLLKIIEQEEQKVQEKLRRKQSAPSKSKKDW